MPKPEKIQMHIRKYTGRFIHNFEFNLISCKIQNNKKF